jgi:MerR family transcriptional regulator, light-induced transcriptional regulator
MDDQRRGVELQGERAGGLSDFASDVVALLLTKGAERPVVLDEPLLQRLLAAVLSGDTEAVAALYPDFRRMNVTPAVLADLYIPEAARRFGDAWLTDEMSFCEVTIGSARLQNMLRDITEGFANQDRRDAPRGLILVIVLYGAQHTLGGLGLAGQLRRRGVSVCLQMGPSDAALRDLVADRRFDGALVTIATTDQIPALTKVVNVLKVATKGTLPIAIGGAVIALHKDQLAATGADIVTNDLGEALDFMGVMTLRPRSGRF